MKNLDFNEILYIDNILRRRKIELECKNQGLLEKIKNLSNIYSEETIKAFTEIYKQTIEDNNKEINECKNIREKLKSEIEIYLYF